MRRTPARFEKCARFAEEALADLPGAAAGAGDSVLTGKVSRGQPGKVRCPACRVFLPVAAIHAEKRVRCKACGAISLVRLPDAGLALLTLVQMPAAAPDSARLPG